MNSEATSKIEITPLNTSVRKRRRTHDVRSCGATPYLFMLPFGILFILFFLIPIAYAFYQSLFSLQRSGLGLGGAQTVFSGLTNYSSVLKDQKFLEGIGRMLLFGAVQIPIMLFLGLTLALLLDSAVARLITFFPSGVFCALRHSRHYWCNPVEFSLFTTI